MTSAKVASSPIAEVRKVRAQVLLGRDDLPKRVLLPPSEAVQQLLSNQHMNEHCGNLSRSLRRGSPIPIVCRRSLNTSSLKLPHHLGNSN
jgi:hypothetical protein